MLQKHPYEAIYTTGGQLNGLQGKIVNSIDRKRKAPTYHGIINSSYKVPGAFEMSDGVANSVQNKAVMVVGSMLKLLQEAFIDG